MPMPPNERRSLEQELAEIPGQITAYWNELENGSPRRTRREFMEWRIRELEKRRAVAAREAKRKKRTP